jgi:hypothetical protein
MPQNKGEGTEARQQLLPRVPQNCLRFSRKQRFCKTALLEIPPKIDPNQDTVAARTLLFAKLIVL